MAKCEFEQTKKPPSLEGSEEVGEVLSSSESRLLALSGIPFLKPFIDLARGISPTGIPYKKEAPIDSLENRK